MASVTPPGASTESSAPAPRQRSARGHGARLRDELLDATVTLLAGAGDPTDVSIRGAAKATGVSPAAVYQHFADRDDLLAAACDHTFSRFGERMVEATNDVIDPFERLRRMGEAYFRFAAEEPGLYRVLFSNPLHHAHDHGDAAAFLGDDSPGPAAFAFLVSLVRDCLDAGAPGLPTAGADPADAAVTLAFHVWAWLHGIVDLRITHAPMPWPPAERMLDDVAVALGLVPEEATTPR